MNPPREEWNLETRRLGRRVLVFERLDSTNNLAASLAVDPANDGLALLADEQTAGRGQYGRSWLAGPRQSVLLSILVCPPPELCRPAVLTGWAAVAVCAVIRETIGWEARIKWPNDVLLDGRKACGILMETIAVGGRNPTIVGIGLNVQQNAATFAASGLPEAISLAQYANVPLDTHALAAALIRRMDRDYDFLCRGDLDTLESNWRRHLDLLGKSVRAECHDATYRGRVRKLHFHGIELARSGEPPLILAPERIRHLWTTEPEV